MDNFTFVHKLVLQVKLNVKCLSRGQRREGEGFYLGEIKQLWVGARNIASLEGIANCIAKI